MNPMMAMGGAPQGMPQGAPMQPPPQPPTPDQMALLDKPSWEEVIGLLKDNVHRSYRIDIETDSTIAASLESDMVGLAQVLKAVGTWMAEAGPMVQSGMLPVDAAKEIAMTITRRARMGTAVEDALDKMQAPKPQTDPKIGIEQAKAQAAAQAAQMQAQMDERAKQSDMQLEQQRMAMEAQAEEQRQQREMIVEQHKQDAQAKDSAYQHQLETQRDQMQAMLDKATEDGKAATAKALADQNDAFNRWKVEQDNETKIAVAEIGAGAKAAAKAESDAAAGIDGEEAKPETTLDDVMNTVNQALQGMFDHGQSQIQSVVGMLQQQQDLFDQKHAEVVDAVTKPRPRKFERGLDGKIASVDGRPVKRDMNGRIESIE